jgi:iron complex transport system ATP-binding protein
MNTSLLAFQDIAFRYQPHNGPVLRQLELEIQPGTVTAILGPNGVGKTTLLHLALGWLRPERQGFLGRQTFGYVLPLRVGSLDGTGATERAHAVRLLGFGVCLARARALSQATRNAGPTRWPGRTTSTRASGIERTGAASHHPVEWGRAAARVAGTRAQQPLLLLDEPTSHLDLGNKSRLLGLIHELVVQGVTILLTTHEPEVAASIATHIVLMERGHVYHAGTLDQVLTTERLTATYGVSVQVVNVAERRVVLWG